VILESFAETIMAGSQFLVSTDDMLHVAGAFEAIIRSMEQGGPVRVARD
jgi:hypothetical protein